LIPDSILAEAAAADSAALAAAAGSAEEALTCHRDALAALAEGWRSETGSAATSRLQRQCADAAAIVAQLHRAAVELTLLRDDWIQLSGHDSGGVAETPMVDASPPETDRAAERLKALPALPPLPDPASGAPAPPTAPLSTQPAVATPQSPPSWQPGSPVPPVPDFGGALLGLVAQIAQALGSYTDTSGPVPAAVPVEKLPQEPAESPQHHKRRIPPTVSTATSARHASAIPKSAVPQPNPLIAAPAAPPGLLAAERPPDPAPPVQPPPVLPPAPVVPVPPVAEPPNPATPVPAPPGAASKTPCEIAADELPKVGE
jgi:hypothetical protein